jgi:hypothetical protein
MNRHDRRAAGITDPFAYRDGDRLMVLRPDDPAIPLAISKEALRADDGIRIDNLMREAESKGVSYTFVGWLALGCSDILDDTGNVIGKMAPGDSLCGRR